MNDDLPPMPEMPARAKSIGIAPSETADLADPIQSALDAASPGDVLVFGPGTFRHSKALRARVPGVQLWSDGARLYATNPLETALVAQADDVQIYGFRLHTVTSTRQSGSLQARLLALGQLGQPRLKGIVFRQNIVEEGPDTPNGSSAVGILSHHVEADVLENTVSRTLADGIHFTQGSRRCRALCNTVKETGDDMIAAGVSYIESGAPAIPPAQRDAEIVARAYDRLVSDILVAKNILSGNYHGRGITVVGGSNITISRNYIDQTTQAAAIMLGRESNYDTFGVRNVLVQYNTITDCQTTVPAYMPSGYVFTGTTGHGAIEINIDVTDEEAALQNLREALRIRGVLVQGNSIARAKAAGIRVNPRGTKQLLMSDFGLVYNSMVAVASPPINIMVSSPSIYCDGNTDEGLPYLATKSCGGPPLVTGCA